MTARLNVLSLFAGIGGLELGLERAGMTTVGQVELDPYCRRVLAKHWPEVPKHDDVRTAGVWWNGAERPRVDVVCGGFPCQPVSVAGRRNAQQDERWLWPAMADVIEAVRPEWVIGENVSGLLDHGLDDVLDDLGRLGYRTRVGSLSACSVGAPHPRLRLFIVGHAASVGCDAGGDPAGPFEEPRRWRYGAGRPGWWEAEPAVGRVAHGIPGGMDRLRALGNAVVPQVAEHIGRIVMAHASAALS